jgi:hypothetical protein
MRGDIAETGDAYLSESAGPVECLVAHWARVVSGLASRRGGHCRMKDNRRVEQVAVDKYLEAARKPRGAEKPNVHCRENIEGRAGCHCQRRN